MAWLREAVALARDLACNLLVLCSRAVTATEAGALGAELHIPVIAVDVSKTVRGLPLMFSRGLLAGTQFDDDSDVSEKRNLALVLSRLAGWERVLFLDDDISGIDPADVRAAAGMLDKYDAVGLDNVGFPDNSVVCHFFREIGGDQQQFVGSGGLVVSPTRSQSMFPDIYNQDWFFLIGETYRPQVAVTGTMRQKDFDPFANPRRAREEEFGDCLAEGLFWLLDEGSSPGDAGTEHWRGFLARRRLFTDELIRRATRLALRGARGRRQLASLTAAQQTCAKINPSICVEYLNRWRHDLAVWRRFVTDLPTGLGPRQALAELGLASVTTPLVDD